MNHATFNLLLAVLGAPTVITVVAWYCVNKVHAYDSVALNRHLFAEYADATPVDEPELEPEFEGADR